MVKKNTLFFALGMGIFAALFLYCLFQFFVHIQEVKKFHFIEPKEQVSKSITTLTSDDREQKTFFKKRLADVHDYFSLKIRHLLLLTIFALIGILAFFCLGFLSTSISTFSIPIILALGNLFLWLVIYIFPEKNFPDGSLVSSYDDLSNALQINQQHSNVKQADVGLLLTKIAIPAVNKTMLHGFLRQTSYQQEQSGLTIGNQENISLSEAGGYSNSNRNLILWRFNGLVTTLNDYKCYPFSRALISVEISPSNLSTPIALLPEKELLESKGRCTWLDENFSIPGYRITDTFVTYKQHKNCSRIQPYNSLSFNISLQHCMIGGFFSFMLPLFVIIFATFGLLWIPAVSRFTTYSGIFFATVLLHRSYRNFLDLAYINYFEFFFFSAYMALIILMIATLLQLFNENNFDFLSSKIKQAFWPTQLISWILITLYFFC